MILGSIFAGLSLLFTFYCDNTTVKINQNTDKAVIDLILGLDARLLDKHEDANTFQDNAFIYVDRYNGLNKDRQFQQKWAKICLWLSVIFYLLAIRGIYRETGTNFKTSDPVVIPPDDGHESEQLELIVFKF